MSRPFLIRHPDGREYELNDLGDFRRLYEPDGFRLVLDDVPPDYAARAADLKANAAKAKAKAKATSGDAGAKATEPAPAQDKAPVKRSRKAGRDGAEGKPAAGDGAAAAAEETAPVATDAAPADAGDGVPLPGV